MMLRSAVLFRESLLREYVSFAEVDLMVISPVEAEEIRVVVDSVAQEVFHFMELGIQILPIMIPSFRPQSINALVSCLIHIQEKDESSGQYTLTRLEYADSKLRLAIHQVATHVLPPLRIHEDERIRAIVDRYSDEDVCVLSTAVAANLPGDARWSIRENASFRWLP